MTSPPVMASGFGMAKASRALDRVRSPRYFSFVQRLFFVYILSSDSQTIYVGITNDLLARLAEHQSGSGGGFTARYNVNRLVYFEEWDGALQAIAREKQIKAWRREKKIELIESSNPGWVDLAEEAMLRMRPTGLRSRRG